MILYILLIAFAGLMTLIAIGFLIGGLMKKRQKVWVGGLIGFVVFTMVHVFKFPYFEPGLSGYCILSKGT